MIVLGKNEFLYVSEFHWIILKRLLLFVDAWYNNKNAVAVLVCQKKLIRVVPRIFLGVYFKLDQRVTSE